MEDDNELPGAGRKVQIPGTAATPPGPSGEEGAPAQIADTNPAPAEDGAVAPAAPAAEPGAAAATEPAAPAGPRHYKDEYRSEIAERFKARRAAERTDPQNAELMALAERTSAIAPAEDAPAAAPAPAAPVPAAAEPSAAAAAPAPAPARAAFTTVKINGALLDVPTEEVEAAGGVAAYQIEKAGEARLANLKRLENQLRDRLATTPANAPTSAGPAPGGKPAPAPSPAAGGLKDAARKLQEGVLESDTDAIAAALEEIASSRPAAPAAAPASESAPAPAAPAPTRSHPYSKADIDAANALMAQEFGDLLKNEAAYALAQAQVVRSMQDPALNHLPLTTLARSACSLVGRHIAVQPAPAPSSVQERLDTRRIVKQRMPVSTTATTALPPVTTQPATPETRTPQARSAYVQRLRARSGSNSSIAERAAR